MEYNTFQPDLPRVETDQKPIILKPGVKHQVQRKIEIMGFSILTSNGAARNVQPQANKHLRKWRSNYNMYILQSNSTSMEEQKVKPLISPYQPNVAEQMLEFRVPIYPTILIKEIKCLEDCFCKAITLQRMIIHTIYENQNSSTVEIKWVITDYPPEYTEQQILEILEEHNKFQNT